MFRASFLWDTVYNKIQPEKVAIAAVFKLQRKSCMPDVVPVVLSFNYEARRAPAYQISNTVGNAQPSY